MARNVFSVDISWKRQYGRNDPRLAAMKNDYAVEVFFKPDVFEPPRENSEGEPQNSPPPSAGEVAKWLMEDGVGEKNKVWDVWGTAKRKFSRPKWQRYVYRMIPNMIRRGGIQNIYQGYMKFAQVVKHDFVSVISSIRKPRLEKKTIANKTEREIADDPTKPLIESGTMMGAVFVRVKKIPPKTSRSSTEEPSLVSSWRGQIPSWLRGGR